MFSDNLLITLRYQIQFKFNIKDLQQWHRKRKYQYPTSRSSQTGTDIIGLLTLAQADLRSGQQLLAICH